MAKAKAKTADALPVTLQGDTPLVSSVDVARLVNVNHRNLTRRIANYCDTISHCSKLSVENFFVDGSYTTSRGRTYRMYYLTRQGCDMVANKMTGDRGILFTAEYVNRFYEMEAILAERRTTAWLEARRLSKLSARERADTIKKLVDYAAAQGSQHSDKLYLVYARLANMAVGIAGDSRDMATIKQLNDLDNVEKIINRAIEEGMTQSLPYKLIYVNAKLAVNSYLFLLGRGELSCPTLAAAGESAAA